MRINSVTYNYFATPSLNNKGNEIKNNESNSVIKELPRYYTPLTQVSFSAKKESSRTVPDIDYFVYKSMTENQKQFFRKKCLNYNKEVNREELNNKQKRYLPLMDDKVMEQFIDVCKMYRELRDEPILCLGRSPKWFLNTALWMEDGLDDYKFVPFSKFWYHGPRQDYRRVDALAPNENEKKHYKNFLKSIQADPKHIVEVARKTGRKVVITDYISSGKGMLSFLDIMSEFAEKDGILEEFANSIRILGIGSMAYQEQFYYDDEELPEPHVIFPERMQKYARIIPQEYKDMPMEVFEQMLINENTNECRSSFYPREAWTLYKPGRYCKTGIIPDQKLQSYLEEKKIIRCLNNFTPAMRDYRNLLNFRILDYLSNNGMLREHLNSKQWD